MKLLTTFIYLINFVYGYILEDLANMIETLIMQQCPRFACYAYIILKEKL